MFRSLPHAPAKHAERPGATSGGQKPRAGRMVCCSSRGRRRGGQGRKDCRARAGPEEEDDEEEEKKRPLPLPLLRPLPPLGCLFAISPAVCCTGRSSLDTPTCVVTWSELEPGTLKSTVRLSWQQILEGPAGGFAAGCSEGKLSDQKRAVQGAAGALRHGLPCRAHGLLHMGCGICPSTSWRDSGSKQRMV